MGGSPYDELHEEVRQKIDGLDPDKAPNTEDVTVYILRYREEIEKCISDVTDLLCRSGIAAKAKH